MARPKSDEKRSALLTAATDVFAERGIWLTPTSAIAKAAGVADGTLFTYFSTKDELLNELYRALKLELADVIMANFPRGASLHGRMRHLWEGYVRWGAANPAKVKVLSQLGQADQITPDSRAIGAAPFAEVEHLAAEITSGQPDAYPVPFLAALFNSMAEATMAALAHSSSAEFDYCAAGFAIFWRGIGQA